MIRAQGVTKKFKNGKEEISVLKNLSIEVDKGEFVSIMGPSGSGKTSLLYALSGMENITSGNVWFKNVLLNDIGDLKKANIRRLSMGFVFQQPIFLKNLSLIDNILMPTFDRKDISKREAYNRGQDLMESVGIDFLGERHIHEVSGGQLQRASICRALMNDPEIIFADEPTGALNAHTSNEIMEVLSTIHEGGKTILLVTHNPKVSIYADRVIFLKDGIIVDEINFLKDKITDRQKRQTMIMRSMLAHDI